MLVKPTGAPVPMEASRKRIDGPTEVPETPYYRRRILAGELEVVPPSRKLRAVDTPPKPAPEPPVGGESPSKAKE